MSNHSKYPPPTLFVTFRCVVRHPIVLLPPAGRPCSIALAALPVTQVSVERLLSALRLLFLSDLWPRLEQDAVEAMLLLYTNMI